MAFGVISPFAHQRVTLGTEMALDINISGNPQFAYIVGLLDGFYTNWKNPILEVRGAGTQLINNRPFTVKAMKGSEEITRAGLFSVVPAAPVITHPGRQKFVRGVENSFIVPVSNSPSQVRASGPWVGMKTTIEPNVGVRIFGIVPEVSHAIPKADQKIRLTAESGALKDEAEIDFDLLSRYFFVSINSDVFYQIQFNENNNSISTNLSFGTNIRELRYLASDEDYIYFGSITSPQPRRNVYRVPHRTGNGRTVNATQIGVYGNGGGLAIDGNDMYRLEDARSSSTNIQVRVFDKTTGVTKRTFFLDFRQYGRGIVIDGDDIIVQVTYSRGNQWLRWYNKNTRNRARASYTRQIRLPINSRISFNDLEVFDRTLFVTQTDVFGSTIARILTIDIDTGSVIKNYSVPSSLISGNNEDMYGITAVVR